MRRGIQIDGFDRFLVPREKCFLIERRKQLLLRVMQDPLIAYPLPYRMFQQHKAKTSRLNQCKPCPVVTKLFVPVIERTCKIRLYILQPYLVTTGAFFQSFEEASLNSCTNTSLAWVPGTHTDNPCRSPLAVYFTHLKSCECL